MAFNYRLQYWEARFPNNCTGSINISSTAAAAAAARALIGAHEFILHVRLWSSLSTRCFLVSLIIIVKINETEIKIARKKNARLKKRNVISPRPNTRWKSPIVDIVHFFSRNLYRDSRDCTFLNPSPFATPFPIFRSFRFQLLRAAIVPREVPSFGNFFFLCRWLSVFLKGKYTREIDCVCSRSRSLLVRFSLRFV